MLFLTTQLPYPAQSGGVIKTWRLIEYFSQCFDLSVLCLLKNEDEKNVEEFKKILPHSKVYVFPCHVDRAIKPLINSYISNKTLNVFRNYSQAAEKKVSDIVDREDILFVDHYEMFQYVPNSLKSKVVLHQHNAEYILWERFADLEPNVLKKAVLVQEARRIKNAEKKYCHRADLVFAAPQDIISLSSLGVNPSKFKETYHLGEDDMLCLPPLIFSKDKKHLLFVGTLTWEANVDGLVHFLSNIFPLILKEKADVHFDIIGKNPSNKLKMAVEQFAESVSLTGFVEDLEPYFQRSAAFILPLRFGSGMKVKFINAMYRGIPVVSSSIGAESIAVENGQSALITDSDERFAESCTQLIKDEMLWNKLSKNSRQIALENYQWADHLNSLTDEINSMS